jgi:hypothetical protein
MGISYVHEYLVESGKSSQRIMEQDRSWTSIQRGVTNGGEFTLKVILMLSGIVQLEVVAWNHKVSFEQDTDGVVNGRAPGNQPWVVPIELAVHLVNAAANCCRIGSQWLQIVAQHLSGGNGVDGCQSHDDFLHQRGVPNPIKRVFVPVS